MPLLFTLVKGERIYKIAMIAGSERDRKSKPYRGPMQMYADFSCQS